MDKQKCLDLAAYSAISCSAYFAGAALYINWVQVPSMFTTAPDTRTLLAEWREMYTRARVIQVITCNGRGSQGVLVSLCFSLRKLRPLVGTTP